MLLSKINYQIVKEHIPGKRYPVHQRLAIFTVNRPLVNGPEKFSFPAGKTIRQGKKGENSQLNFREPKSGAARWLPIANYIIRARIETVLDFPKNFFAPPSALHAVCYIGNAFPPAF